MGNMSGMRNISDLIEDLGGAATVADKTGRSPGAVRQWSFKNKLPRSAWPELIEAYPSQINLKVLKRLEAAVTSTPAAQTAA